MNAKSHWDHRINKCIRLLVIPVSIDEEEEEEEER